VAAPLSSTHLAPTKNVWLSDLACLLLFGRSGLLARSPVRLHPFRSSLAGRGRHVLATARFCTNSTFPGCSWRTTAPACSALQGFEGSIQLVAFGDEEREDIRHNLWNDNTANLSHRGMFDAQRVLRWLIRLHSSNV
jgi:hypothetical protein